MQTKTEALMIFSFFTTCEDATGLSLSAPCSSRSGFNQLTTGTQNIPVCLLHVRRGPDSPLNCHQLPGVVALSQEHAAVRAVPQLPQSGVSVHGPQGALPLLHRGAVTVPHSPAIGHCEPGSILPQINHLSALCCAVSTCHCKALKNTSIHPLAFFLRPLQKMLMSTWRGESGKVKLRQSCLLHGVPPALSCELSRDGQRKGAALSKGKWIKVDMS